MYKRSTRKRKKQQLLYAVGFIILILMYFISEKDNIALIRQISRTKVIFIALAILVTYWGIPVVQKYLKRRKYLHSNIHAIDKMSGIEFEEYLAAHFSKQGYKITNTCSTGDYGADLILTKPFTEIKIIVQAKRYGKNTVGVKAVQEVISALAYYKGNKGMVVTNSFFTKNAIEMAHKCNIELWDRTKLTTEFKRKNMKKKILILIILIMISVTGCSKPGEKTSAIAVGEDIAVSENKSPIIIMKESEKINVDNKNKTNTINDVKIEEVLERIADETEIND